MLTSYNHKIHTFYEGFTSEEPMVKQTETKKMTKTHVGEYCSHPTITHVYFPKRKFEKKHVKYVTWSDKSSLFLQIILPLLLQIICGNRLIVLPEFIELYTRQIIVFP